MPAKKYSTQLIPPCQDSARPLNSSVREEATLRIIEESIILLKGLSVFPLKIFIKERYVDATASYPAH